MTKKPDKYKNKSTYPCTCNEEGHCECCETERIVRVDDGTWHIGQGYEAETVESLVCKKCGSKEFNVGKGNYYTAIRCVNCKWELCVHEG